MKDGGDEGRLCKLVTMEVVQRWDYPDGGLCKLDLEEYLFLIDLLEEDSQRSENLVLFNLDRGNSQQSENSVHYSGPRGDVLKAAVEHFFIFFRFCSTFSSARHDFGLRGRTFFLFFLFLFYFQLRADRFS